MGLTLVVAAELVTRKTKSILFVDVDAIVIAPLDTYARMVEEVALRIAKIAGPLGQRSLHYGVIIAVTIHGPG